MPPCVLFTLSCGLHLPWQEHTSCLSWYVKRNLDLLCIYRCLHTHPDSLAMWLIFFCCFYFLLIFRGELTGNTCDWYQNERWYQLFEQPGVKLSFSAAKATSTAAAPAGLTLHSMNAEAGVANRDQQLSGALVVRWNVRSCPLMLHAEHGLDSSAQQECSQRLFV